MSGHAQVTPGNDAERKHVEQAKRDQIVGLATSSVRQVLVTEGPQSPIVPVAEKTTKFLIKF